MMERFRDGASQGIERYVDHLARNRFVASIIEHHPDFESFVMHAPDEHRRLRKPQVAFLNNDQKRADFTGRQESLDADLKRIYDHLGLEWVPPSSVNIDPGRPDYREVYTAKTRRRVAELFEADVREYDYEF
jgi:hypothetical protein